ncbi:MAG: CoA transferase, partial [Planctomycetota bacterium]|nr:CoA transferase [Planctomycetota bacterium]
AEVVARLAAAGVPAAPIHTARDLLENEQVRARGQLEEVEVGGRPLRLPAIGPRLVATPGRTDHAGGPLGADTDEVLIEVLGLSSEELANLRARGVIGP